MATAISSYSKQRRSSSAADCLLLSDLPNGILEHAATFLSAPSRALFAVALDENKSAASPNERSSAIVGNQWEVLDFGEVEKELAAKLTDDDIENVLLCIDAVNKVKRVKFTNCVNITGAGLVPLRDSLIIEQIDLSLVGDGESPKLDPEPPISRDHVLTILHSIIEREGCALKYLQFPKAWREDRSTESNFHRFLQRYKEILESRGIHCLECNETTPDHAINTRGEKTYALQNHICYGCLEHYCYDCTDEDDHLYLRYCKLCDRDYCIRCIPILFCENCDAHCTYCKSFVECCTPGCGKKDSCTDCVEKCFKCDRNWCEDCRNIHECDCCHKLCCGECMEEEGANAVMEFCDDDHCYKPLCTDCRLLECQRGNINCSSCISLAFTIVSGRAQELKREVDQLRDENKDLKVENKDLKVENRDLKDENKDLKDQVKRLRTK